MFSYLYSTTFPMSQLFTSGGQNIGVSASTSVLPVNIQDWSPLRWIGWISLKSKRLWRVFPNTINSLVLSFLYSTTRTFIHDYWKNSFDWWNFVSKVTSLLFNILSRLAIAFLPGNKCILIPWLQSPSAVILESKKITLLHFHCFPIYLPWSNETRSHDLHLLNAEF